MKKKKKQQQQEHERFKTNTRLKGLGHRSQVISPVSNSLRPLDKKTKDAFIQG